MPVYGLSPLAFHSVRIKSLAVKHLESSAVKIEVKCICIGELAHESQKVHMKNNFIFWQDLEE